MKAARSLLAAALLLAQAVFIALQWPTLPSTLPSHFALDGTPNRYAPRALLWLLLGVEIAVVLMLTLVQRFPHAFNLPDPTGSPRRPHQEALAIEMLNWMRLEVTLLFACILGSIVTTAQHKTNGLGEAFIFVFIALTVITSLYYIRQMKRP